MLSPAISTAGLSHGLRGIATDVLERSCTILILGRLLGAFANHPRYNAFQAYFGFFRKNRISRVRTEFWGIKRSFFNAFKLIDEPHVKSDDPTLQLVLNAILTRKVIEVVDINGNLRDADDVLRDVARGLSRISSQTERMDIAQAILGRGGTRLLPALQEGSLAIGELENRFSELGNTMSGEFALKSAALIDAQTDMTTAWGNLKTAIATPFLEPATAAIGSLASAIGTLTLQTDAAGDSYRVT